MRMQRNKTPVIRSEGCSWRNDDGTYCGDTAAPYRTKHCPSRSKTWLYCPFHRYALRRIAAERVAS